MEVTEGVDWVCWGGVTLQQSKLACLRARGNSGCGKLGHVELWLLTGKLGTRTGKKGLWVAGHDHKNVAAVRIRIQDGSIVSCEGAGL